MIVRTIVNSFTCLTKYDNMLHKSLFFFFLSLSFFASAQVKDNADAAMIKKIYDTELTNGKCYLWLYDMCTKIGGRLSGSDNAAKAVDYTKKMLDTSGISTRLQACMVPHWVRGAKEEVLMRSKQTGDSFLRALSIGNAVGTGAKGIEAEVIEVKSLDEVTALGDKVKGKIVFYNQPMNRTYIQTFRAYSESGVQRYAGPSRAAQFGALGVLVRSLTTEHDDNPHTGSLRYDEKYPKIPAICISTNDADKLSAALKNEAGMKVFMKSNCEMLPDVESFNVIGEIKGSEKPEEIIVVGGHLDSWDPAQGAHDDGAGSVQSMEVLSLLKRTGYQPKRTIRCVLFMNEENGLKGALKYAEEAKKATTEKHIFALESDEGGFSPREVSFEGDSAIFAQKYPKIEAWSSLMKPYGIDITKGGSGADVGTLRDKNIILAGLRPDCQRYFDFHHTAMDRIEGVNRRELELGAATITAIIYLIDKYGL